MEPSSLLSLPPGFRIGHWEDREGITGCTVVLCPPGTVGGCEVRGGSPGSRELSLLSSEKTMQVVHALLLTGGSAFGLAAADGVMRFLEERGIGYETPWARVPIVPGAVIFDLNVGSPEARPGREAGYGACKAASAGEVRQGSLGAGLGATVGKWRGLDGWMKGGIGIATHGSGELVVTALVVVNAVGDVLDESGRTLAGARTPEGRWAVEDGAVRTIGLVRRGGEDVVNTTLAAILTNAKLSKVEANRVAQKGHDGMARAITPVHTSFDGDTVFTLAAGPVPAGADLIGELGADAIARAIRGAVRHAISLGGVPALSSH